MKATPRMHTYGKLPAKITINSEQHGAQWGFSDKKAQKTSAEPTPASRHKTEVFVKIL
ncbi:MAG: hypothetical protein MR517_05140 [Bacteroidales bacterium]|nr:hypothetical protein [Bacteroidales bacterium]